MGSALFACQPIVCTIPQFASNTNMEPWQLVAGLEAALILVLFTGWLHATRATPQRRDCDDEEST